MIIDDKVYGKTEIIEPVIIDLINSPSLQRLKYINQGGFNKSFNLCAECTRFDHSVGDYTLLKNYNARIEEQINGLLHDTSHSAFSHCIDYILDSGSQKTHSHQDDFFKEYVLQTEIPKILKKHNFDVDYILDDSDFNLQELEAPDLCADRIDYSLREMTLRDGYKHYPKYF